MARVRGRGGGGGEIRTKRTCAEHLLPYPPPHDSEAKSFISLAIYKHTHQNSLPLSVVIISISLT